MISSAHLPRAELKKGWSCDGDRAVVAGTLMLSYDGRWGGLLCVAVKLGLD